MMEFWRLDLHQVTIVHRVGYVKSNWFHLSSNKWLAEVASNAIRYTHRPVRRTLSVNAEEEGSRRHRSETVQPLGFHGSIHPCLHSSASSVAPRAAPAQISPDRGPPLEEIGPPWARAPGERPRCPPADRWCLGLAASPCTLGLVIQRPGTRTASEKACSTADWFGAWSQMGFSGNGWCRMYPGLAL
jgi:hypothetical protein